MRRSFLKLLAAALPAGLLPPRVRAAEPDAPAAAIDALQRPALLSPKATGSAMLALALAGKRLVAAGERGIVLLSDDDGRHWRQAQVPVSAALTALHFVDDRRGWAVGHLGVVLHTADGGEHWVLQLDGRRAASIALRATQASHAEDAAAIAREAAAAQALVDDGPDKPFLDVFFENEHTGYVTGAYNLAFRTDDGGRHWQSWMGHLANPKGLHLYAMGAAGGSLFIAGEQGLLLRSSDGGRQFVPAVSPSKGTYFGLVVGHDGELLLYGLRGRAFRSADAAQTWTEIDTGTRASLSAGVCLRDGSLLLASQAGELMLSRDGGRSFRPAPGGIGLPVTAL
ncbi:MAG TPA: YCF48-related protein, partial [Ideonella sp.]|nr:YCF48-related protein [Ideonella sp.]